MTKQLQATRRGLFKGLLQNNSSNSIILGALRPPGALPEIEFIECCVRCNDCMTACPENVIVKGDGGFPELNFSNGGCSGCAKCITVCEPAALRPNEKLWPIGDIVNSNECLPNKGVTCQSCKDACDLSAISFPMTLTTPRPDINHDICTGCGECVSVCPVDSLSVVALQADSSMRELK